MKQLMHLTVLLVCILGQSILVAQDCTTDERPPVAICTEKITYKIPLGETQGKIWTHDVDDGSYDECSDVILAISDLRDSFQTPPVQEFLEFTRDDLTDGCLHVVLWVSDASGNFNVCFATMVIEGEAGCHVAEPIYCYIDVPIFVGDDILSVTPDMLVVDPQPEQTVIITYPDGLGAGLAPNKLNASLVGEILVYKVINPDGSYCTGVIRVSSNALCEQFGTPVAICREHLFIEAYRTVLAREIDGGSYSNCSPVELTISKASEGLTAPPVSRFMQLVPEDFTDNVAEVILWVTDENGVFSSCWTQVFFDSTKVWNIDPTCPTFIADLNSFQVTNLDEEAILTKVGLDVEDASYTVAFYDRLGNEIPNAFDYTSLDDFVTYRIYYEDDVFCDAGKVLFRLAGSETILVFNDGVAVTRTSDGTIIGDELTDYCNDASCANGEIAICDPWNNLDNQESAIDVEAYLSEPTWTICANYTIDMVVEHIDLDVCQAGSAVRVWRIVDECGNDTLMAKQLEILPRSDFEVEFPKDVTIYEGDDTGEYGYPIITDAEVELVGIAYEDLIFNHENGKRISRSWIVIDWCSFDPERFGLTPEVAVSRFDIANICNANFMKDGGDGYMEYVQEIKILKEPLQALNISNIEETQIDCTTKQVRAILSGDLGDDQLVKYEWMDDQDHVLRESYSPTVNINKSGSYKLVVRVDEEPVGDKTFVVNTNDQGCKKEIGDILISFPNPSRGAITIGALDNESYQGSLDIRDLHNRTVRVIKRYQTGQLISLDGLSQGTYFAFFESDQFYGVTKLTKM